MQNHSVTSGSSPVDKAHPTPGPWVIVENGSNGILAKEEAFSICSDNSDKWSVCAVWKDCQTLETAKANAALIASAPDLKAENIRLKANNEKLLNQALDLINDNDINLDKIDKLKAINEELLAALVAVEPMLSMALTSNPSFWDARPIAKKAIFDSLINTRGVIAKTRNNHE